MDASTDSVISRLERPATRFAAAIATGVAVFLATSSLYFELRVLLTYNALVGIYLMLLLSRMLRTDADCAAIFLNRSEPSGLLMLLVTPVISTFGLTAVGILVENDPSWPRSMHTARLVLSLLAIFLSWLLLNVGFASHYARLFFAEIGGPQGTTIRRGLEIPNKDRGDYWDFLYDSFTIAMCYQTSDIAVTDERIRRLTLIHALISSLYGAVIFGLVVNVISNIV
ncbi:MAG: DUF1345 domain-containing protein [Planctomycetaceae bacterium]|nr:MAG: DUF1345 domain-containing protein [Planctomycetaceae bacterium]